MQSPSFQEEGPELKKYLGWATMPFLVGVVLSLFAVAYWYVVSAHSIRSGNEIHQLNVTGEGKIAVKPDIAMFTAGVVTQAKKIRNAQLENTRRSNAIISFLKSHGIKEKDIKTVGYSVYPQYTYPEPPCLPGVLCQARTPTVPEIVSYEVRHTLEIKARDLEKVDEFLEGVVTNGGNEVGSVSFTLDQMEIVRQDARKKAIENAKTKAETIARDMGVKLKRITGFSESGGPYPIFAYSAKGGFGGGEDRTTPEVKPGEQEITSTVTITYEFR